MKILIVRFSSIGDIVLTTPVIRCLKTQLEDVEIHFLTKKKFATVLEENPYIDKLISIENKINEVIDKLKAEKYDHIVDLHKNLRTYSLKRKLGRPSTSFEKLNKEKWLLVNFKKNTMPNVHIVDRYMATVGFLNIKNDNKGLDYFIKAKDEVNIPENLNTCANEYIAIVVGSLHATKQLPIQKTIDIINQLSRKVILLGGPEDYEKAEIINKNVDNKAFNACGKFNLNQSASIVKQARNILTSDTGLMHIASAFRKKIVSLWGNTVPEFGMYPYMPEEYKDRSHIFEVKGLKCRPCSKLGFNKCPKKHFDCMNKISNEEIIEILNR